MNTDLEELLRDGMERFTEGVSAPAGLAQAAGRLHRRRAVALRAALASGTAAVLAVVAVIAVVAVAGAGTGTSDAQTVAYVTRQVQRAVASENMVFVGHTHGSFGPSVTWAYGKHSRWVEYWPATDYRDRVVNGQWLWDFPPQDRGQAYSAEGTARVGGKLVGAYVIYPDRRYNLSPQLPTQRSACTTTGALELGGPAAVNVNWKSFIEQMLACGAASATGRVRVDGVETTKITGKPVTVRLSSGYRKAVRENWVTVRWALYVNPVTYLPVRMEGSTKTYGGAAGTSLSSGVTNVQWLQPTKANIAKAMVTIPPGFKQVSLADV
jgi:hypothetical protein